MEHALKRNLDAASEIVPNKVHKMRSWQTKLKELVANQHTSQLLETPLSEWPCSKQYTQTKPQIDNDAILKSIDAELGSPLEEIQEDIQSVMDLYKETVQQLFAANNALLTKFEKIQTLRSKLENIHDLEEEDSRECLKLKESIVEYVQSRYKDLQIDEDYVTFCKLYARFSALRATIHMLYTFGQHTEVLNIPMCTICTCDRIQTALIPCGHTFCESCSTKQKAQCYICRTTIKEKQKLFFM